jgi:hypothetical protein
MPHKDGSKEKWKSNNVRQDANVQCIIKYSFRSINWAGTAELAQQLDTGLMARVRFPEGQRFFFSPQPPDRFWDQLKSST